MYIQYTEIEVLLILSYINEICYTFNLTCFQ